MDVWMQALRKDRYSSIQQKGLYEDRASCYYTLNPWPSRNKQK